MLHWLARHRDRLRYLDIALSLQRDVRVRVIERPGLWMEPAALDELIRTLRGIVVDGIGNELQYGVLSGDIERLHNAVITVVYDRADDRAVAFNALSYMPIQVRGRTIEALHLGLVMVDPAYRAKGMSWILYTLTCVLMFFRRGLRPLWISNVTQVPAVIGKVAEGFVNAYPNPFQPTRCSFDQLVVAREVMARHRQIFGVGDEAIFDEARMVITNAYTGGSDNLKKTFEQAPKHRDERANELCARELDYVRGDDFLQIARLDLVSARAYLLREVPRHSLPALLYQLAFILVGSMVLPLLHWLNPREAMGDLRART